MNKLVWEATLWHPDETALELNKLMYYAQDRKTPKELLVMVKEYLKGKTSLKPSEIVHF